MANPFDQFDSPVAQTGKDVALSFGQGATGLLKSVGDIYGLTTGDMDNVVSRKAQEAIESLQTQKSPEVLQMEEKRRQAVEAETGTLDKAWAYLSNTAPEFRLALGDIAQAAPSVLGTGGAGAAVRAGARMLGAGAKTAAKTGLGGAIATGAGLQAGEAGASQYAELVKTLGEMPDEQKAQIPQIADLMQRKGASLEDATTALLLDLSRDAGVFAALTSAASMAIPGGTSIERSLVGGAAKQPAKSLLSGVAKSAAGETGQEVLENIGAEVGKNIFARPVEPEREITRGVGEAMGASVLPALAMGGAAGAAQSISRPEPTPRPAPVSRVVAGMSEETPAPAATKPSLAAEQQATLERSEDMTSEQFFATVNVRQARLLGGEPNPEDIKLVGDAPPPRVIIDPDMMRSAIDETQQALNDWKARNPNAPENMVIVFDPEMLHNGFGIQGAFNQRDGSIFINAAFVAPENVGKIASHEWAHATLASPEGQRAFAEFAAREIPQEDLDALATRYGTQDRMVLLEEWIAENQEKAPGVISRIVARIREWLSGLGILDLSDAEVADIMLRSLREQAENKIQPDTQRVEGGIAPDQNLEVYETFIGNRLDAGPKMALQKLPTAADVTDAKGNLRYTIPKKTLDVSHYSFVPNLTEVDPAYYGTGQGEHYHRMMKGINKSFFFVANSRPKAYENVSGKGMNRYRTTIDSSRIYDINKDPLDLWFAPNPQKSEGLLKELGYDGFLAKTDDGRSFVALFYPTSLETGEMTRAAQPMEEAVSEEPQESAEEYLARVEREEAAERRKALRRASSGKYSLTQEPERISGIMASPSITDIQYDRAKRNLTSANQARFKSQITDYAPDADIFDAVGDWVDGAENSVAAIFRDRKPVDELQRLAAKAGLAGDQKAVLWWSTDPKGVDAIHEIVWPKGVSMDDARQAMIDVGLENRTLIQTPDGIRGFVFDQGRQNLNKIEALHEHETQPSLDSSPASGDFLGSWSSRAEGRRAYRRVLGSTPQTETGAGELRSEQVGTGGEPETRFSLAQTKTPEFKRFFGDWDTNPDGASKVVDENGKPRILFHGTIAGLDFAGFNTKSSAAGSHFATIPAVASSFAKGFRGPAGSRVIPVYLNIRNPWRSRDLMDWSGTAVIKEWANQHGQTYEKVEQEFNRVLEEENAFSENDTRQVQLFLKSKGHDGIVYLNRYEVYAPGEENIPGERYARMSGARKSPTDEEFLRSVPEATDAWIAFDPEQIKSATGNVGAFGQRPVTAEEAQRMGLTEEEAAEAQKRGDIRMSLTGKPVGEQALEDAKRLTFSNQKEVSKYLGELLRKEVPEGLDDESPEARRKLAELLDRELSLALTMPENADAIGWYSREMDKVFEILRSPELDYQLDDPINRGVFNAILAITSNGQKVVPQFLKTAQLYEGWRKTGQIPSVGKWGGERSRAIKNHVKFLNQMLEAVGPEQTVNFLTSEQSLGEHLNNLYGMVAEAQNLPEKATVANKKAAIRKYLNAKMPGGELVDYNAVGAIVFGPKLGGGFFANLYGKFDRLTMDRWFMRTFHRMTGRLGEDRPEMVQSILKEARMEAADVLPEDVTDEEILNEIVTTGKQAFKDYKEIKRRLKQDPNDTEAYGLDVMRRLYNRYLKAKSGLYDAPDNGSHRKFIREVLDEVQKLRAERGETKIETSDIQAILWYLEKDIWNRLRQSMDADAVAEADAQQDEDEGEDEDTAGRVSYSDGARELYRRKARREYGEGNEKPKERVLAGA